MGCRELQLSFLAAAPAAAPPPLLMPLVFKFGQAPPPTPQNKNILYLSLPSTPSLTNTPPLLPSLPAVQRGHVTLGPSPSGSLTDPSRTAGLRGPSCRLSVKHLERNVWPGKPRLLPPLISARGSSCCCSTQQHFVSRLLRGAQSFGIKNMKKKEEESAEWKKGRRGRLQTGCRGGRKSRRVEGSSG